MGSECGRDELVERLAVECTHALTNHLAALEEQEGGNVADAELPRDGLVVVHIHLADAQPPFIVSRHLVQDRGDGLACKAIAPVLDQMAGDYEGRLSICKVDVDHNQAIAGQFGVRNIPTLLLFKGGEVVGQRVGALNRKALDEFVSTAL